MKNGRDAGIFRESRDKKSPLKWGILSIAIGIALFAGHFIEEYTSMDEGAGYFPLIFMFGGAALIFYYRRIYSEYEDEKF